MLIALIGTVLADHPSSFNQAKKRAESEIYSDHLSSFYCGCDITFSDPSDLDGDGNLNEKLVIPEGCGYEPRRPFTSSGKTNSRTERVEWEHIVPAHLMGGHLKEWREPKTFAACERSNGKFLSGRDCAYKLVPSLKKAHDDLHNLVPAVGELNADRSNYPFGIIEGELRAYGACDFEVDFDTDIAEPADNVKGNIARVYLYMNSQYKIDLPAETTELIKAWNLLDPVDDWECDRNERIKSSQGNGNPFVAEACNFE